MSRSEHGNARDRKDPHDRARKANIKTLIVSERRHLDTNMPPVSGDAIPCVVVDEHPCVHYPASVEDIRGVLARLPEGSLNGLAGIELVLSQPEPEAVDPYLGRLRAELMAGMFAPATLGSYTPGETKIRLYAYVYNSAPPYAELYLRLAMLSTLVHEVGHHQDYMAHETRGRWRAERDLEPKAEAREAEWVRTCVVPYVEEAYAAEIAQLQAWLRRVIGTPLPLEILVAAQGAMFGARDAFEHLLDGGTTVDDLRTVAFRLHYDYHFELALAVLDHATALAPDDLETASDRAHVLVHLERYAEADAISRSVLEREPRDEASLYVLCKSAIRECDWPAVVYFASSLLEVARHRQTTLFARARAHIELCDWNAAELDIGELRSIATDHDQVRLLSCLWNVRRGRDEAAFELAANDPELVHLMRSYGHDEWADRLEARESP